MEYLGIDIGGTKISCALINEQGEIIKPHGSINDSEIEKFQTPKSVDEIKNLLTRIIAKYDEAEFAAIATAGAVNNENTGILGSTANMPQGYADINFQNLSNKKVFIENDANAASYAEYKIGASRGYKNSIMLTLGTGVGGGIIIDGKLLKGKLGAAGEMHFPLSRHKRRKCTCGFYDCFEAYASGNGLKITAQEIYRNNKITTYDVIDDAKRGDKRALLALETWQNDIALGCVALANIFDPDCIVLSGSMEQFVDTERMERFVNENIVTTPTKIFHARAGNYAGMIGAVLLALDKAK